MEDRINNLESRISALEARNASNRLEASISEEQVTSCEAEKLYKLAETSFKTVLDADIHLDNKASRILSAMAFLTAASAGIFAKAYSPNLITPEIKQNLIHSLSAYAEPPILDKILQQAQQSYFLVFGFDVALCSFGMYTLFVILGAGFYLYAIGPSLNIPFSLRSTNKRELNDSLKSLLFFKTISSVEQQVWQKGWEQRKCEELQTITKDNFIQESYLIAQKAATKETLMSAGSLCFRVAIIFSVPLVVSLFAIDPRLKILLICIGLFLLFSVYAYANLQRPSKDSIRSWMPILIWSLFSLLCLSDIILQIFIK